ncbi:MAG: hypothetical protein ABSB49_19605 [Polyangia bacterium]
MSTPDWRDVLPVPPPGGRLHEAWITTFDQPDAAILVEYLLPSLLGASHSLSQEVQERTLFFGELGTALEHLHGRLTVISSQPTGARKPSQYPWLWRYVSHFTVGANARAVQHAKLWAFHWKVGREEQLDLHISSTNLTASGFKAQVQAGWQATVRLGERATLNGRRTWGEIVPFLAALGSSAGAIAKQRIERLVSLLGRAECPHDITFIASVPGDKSAARQLRRFQPSKIYVMTPTIGEWNSRTLDAWTTDAGVAAEDLHLKWIATSHPWAEKTSGWALSEAAGKALEAGGVQIECLPTAARFTEQHREADPRWSHAKLYLLRSGRRRRLLVTSANWSTAAWGAGKSAPRNFELGVVFESEWTDLESVGEPFDPPETVPFYRVAAEDEEEPKSLEWAEASWDGRLLQLRARSLDTTTPIGALVAFSGGSEVAASVVGGAAGLPWEDATHTPLVARFTQADTALEVDVLDLRPPTELSKTPLPEVDPALADTLREAFLLQRYGGPIIDADSIPGLGDLRRVVGGAPPADYSVQAWLDLRAAFDVVDSWRAALDEAKAEPAMLERVRLDGAALRAIYARREGPAAALVAEELQWRLAEEP